MKKYLDVDYKKCNPTLCDPENKLCRATKECTKKLLIQEEAGDAPILFSSKNCIGCGKCARVCPSSCISITNG